MEIRFDVKMTPEEKRLEGYACIALSLAIILFALLLSFFFLPFVLLAALPYPLLTKYRRMLRPRHLTVESNALIYWIDNKQIIAVPFSAIARFEYDKGIGIILKKPLPAPIRIFESIPKRKPYDIYLEWFEPKACSLLQHHLKQKE
jgi:hypothetical protein